MRSELYNILKHTDKLIKGPYYHIFIDRYYGDHDYRRITDKMLVSYLKSSLDWYMIGIKDLEDGQ